MRNLSKNTIKRFKRLGINPNGFHKFLSFINHCPFNRCTSIELKLLKYFGVI